MRSVPHTRLPDTTISLLREGYRFLPNHMRRLDTHIFETRLLGRRAICVTGPDAAAMFYHPNRFTRQDHAMPPTTLRLLQDVGSVQTLDAGAHEHRKQMFMSMMTAGNMNRLVEIMEKQWEDHLQSWQARDQIVLFDEVEHILTLGGAEWAGVPVDGPEAEKRTQEYHTMLMGAGTRFLTTLKGLLLRQRTEKWAQDRIEDVRNGKHDAPEGSAVHVFATSRDIDGELLPVEIAAIELINILRPIVAVGRFIAFAAHALETAPDSRRYVASGDHEQSGWFANEVRRFYPFFPLIGGVVREEFDWHDRHFELGEWVLLDLHGINHDPGVWRHPHAFEPERFRDTEITPFNMVPQGAGEDWLTTHRCPGEWITIKLIRQAGQFLTTKMRYTVPDQDMSIDIRSMPTQPKSGMILRDVRPA